MLYTSNFQPQPISQKAQSADGGEGGVEGSDWPVDEGLGGAVLTVVLEPSHKVYVRPPKTSRYDRELLAQAITSPAVSVVVKGNGLLFVVLGGGVIVGGGMLRVVYPHWSSVDVRKGVVVMKDPEEHWQ